MKFSFSSFFAEIESNLSCFVKNERNGAWIWLYKLAEADLDSISQGKNSNSDFINHFLINFWLKFLFLSFFVQNLEKFLKIQRKKVHIKGSKQKKSKQKLPQEKCSSIQCFLLFATPHEQGWQALQASGRGKAPKIWKSALLLLAYKTKTQTAAKTRKK